MSDAENMTDCIPIGGHELRTVVQQDGVVNSVREDKFFQKHGENDRDSGCSHRDCSLLFRITVGDHGDELILVIGLGKRIEQLDS